MLPRIQSTDTAETAFRTKSNQLYGRLITDGYATEAGALIFTAENKTLAINLGSVIYTHDALTDKVTQVAAQIRKEMPAFFGV
ncbi:hypothetical protein [Runella sp.]|uniref:hypothetical protein n=1 Tax=Runella sp. TaxID=1960881 RepID=UPI003D0F175D